MYQYLMEHETALKKMLESTEIQNWEHIKAYHKTQIEFMQHERLIHLLVTLAFGFFFLGTLILMVLMEVVLLFLLAMVIGVLEVFYIVHMFRLENGVQRWYVLYDEICKRESLF